MANVYGIKTDIKLKNNTLLSINILADDLSDAISNASFLKYNGEDLKSHIVSVVILIGNVVINTWNSKDLNPEYKSKEDTADVNTEDPFDEDL